MVDMSMDFYLILLETNLITYDEYINKVPSYAIPSEYKTIDLFMKNKGKVSKRIIKECEWINEARRKGLIDGTL
jgi:hypothetical protein